MSRIVDSDLVGVIDRGEDATLEFKRSLTKDVGRVCARSPMRVAEPFWSAQPATGRELLSASGYSTRTGNFNEPSKASCDEPSGAHDPRQARSGKQVLDTDVFGRRRLVRG
ncbi:MAG: hypothetical protein OXG04_10495 [Acidobacteria bacterium]|nr:hypothetical protein [Acidobacteriota bacterium]